MWYFTQKLTIYFQMAVFFQKYYDVIMCDENDKITNNESFYLSESHPNSGFCCSKTTTNGSAIRCSVLVSI